MLSYRHAFHAGNHADVLKHLVLTATLMYARQKPSPLLYIDTHAGAGKYRLQDVDSRKTGEAQAGILKLDMSALLQTVPPVAQPVLDAWQAALQPFLLKGEYPGSPVLAASLLRREDRLRLFELHTKDFQNLQQNFGRDRRVRVECQDGFSSLNLIPPIEKRAVILVDPSYEIKDDYYRVSDYLLACHKRMRSATLLLWYPVVDRSQVKRMIQRLTKGRIQDLWQFELGMTADMGGHGMTASGILAVNPPWTLPDQLRASLPLIQAQLAPGHGHWLVDCLVPET